VTKLLDRYNIEYQEINVADNHQPDNMKLALTIHTGYSKFPNIYFGEDHIGGLDDLQGLLIQNENESVLEVLRKVGVHK
jgi:glutaredoxin